MKTFSNDTVINFKVSIENRKKLKSICKKLNIKFDSYITNNGYLKNYPYVYFNYTRGKVYATQHNDFCKKVYFKTFCSMLENYKKPVIVKYLTSGRMDAKISSKGITVGCQLITWKSFDEFTKIVEKFRGNKQEEKV